LRHRIERRWVETATALLLLSWDLIEGLSKTAIRCGPADAEPESGRTGGKRRHRASTVLANDKRVASLISAALPPTVRQVSNLNFLFRLSLKFYRLVSSSVARGRYPNDQRPAEDRAIFTASPKSSDGTGHEPAIAEQSRPVTARTALSIVVHAVAARLWPGCLPSHPCSTPPPVDSTAARSVDSHLGSEMRQWSRHKGLELDVFAPTVLTIISLVFILLSAAVVRVLGTDIGYKVLYIVIAFSLVLKTMLGW
jgi:hypothetical protein